MTLCNITIVDTETYLSPCVEFIMILLKPVHYLSIMTAAMA
jgi:hypothetical protein